MDTATLWSLRLGFTAVEAPEIQRSGIGSFLRKSMSGPFEKNMPGFLQDEPKTPAEVATLREQFREDDKRKILRARQAQAGLNLRMWWLEKMIKPFPLREKMTLFWHNHYVSTLQDVKVPYWIYVHNQLLRENCFGNFRELTKKMLHTNAMVVYLNNNRNRKGNYNENLSRELLELFTLGIGNYTEADIKGGARGLAGLSPGAKGAEYRKVWMSDDVFEYFGQKGSFNAEEMTDIIFSQKQAPYFLVYKLLKWLIYDKPPEALVKLYGDYFRENDYEIAPLLTKIATDEFEKPTAGSKIKDPLTYILHVMSELGIKDPDRGPIAIFLRQQGMDLFNQPNVKGWPGGNAWLTAQIFLQRQKTADMLCRGVNLPMVQVTDGNDIRVRYTKDLSINVAWKKGSSREVVSQLSNRLIFDAGDNLLTECGAILKYDFDPEDPGAGRSVIRLVNHLVKTPEFQLI